MGFLTTLKQFFKQNKHQNEDRTAKYALESKSYFEKHKMIQQNIKLVVNDLKEDFIKLHPKPDSFPEFVVIDTEQTYGQWYYSREMAKEYKGTKLSITDVSLDNVWLSEHIEKRLEKEDAEPTVELIKSIVSKVPLEHAFTWLCKTTPSAWRDYDGFCLPINLAVDSESPRGKIISEYHAANEVFSAAASAYKESCKKMREI